MDKISKVLKKLSAKEREWIRELIEKITASDFQGLHIEKLSGNDSIFRARKGDIRIIYRKESAKDMHVLAVERRSEKTYRNF